MCSGKDNGILWKKNINANKSVLDSNMCLEGRISEYILNVTVISLTMAVLFLPWKCTPILCSRLVYIIWGIGRVFLKKIHNICVLASRWLMKYYLGDNTDPKQSKHIFNKTQLRLKKWCILKTLFCSHQFLSSILH